MFCRNVCRRYNEGAEHRDINMYDISQIIFWCSAPVFDFIEVYANVSENYPIIRCTLLVYNRMIFSCSKINYSANINHLP